MAGWSTVERLDEGTYAISEYRHWEHTHCYLLLGRDRALVIDTGLGVAPLAPVVGTLTALPLRAIRPGHHSLDVSPALAGQVLDALEGLEREGRLRHGEGILEFGGFQLHL